MKRIIYFLLIVSVSALYSCTGQYDNIEQYATDETVYIGKFSEDPYMRVGYKRVEIELMGDSVGRAFSDDLYLGKAKKTVIEYDEADGLRRLVYDSVCSWVNIQGLTTAKTYVFTIYAEDGLGNRSISTEALGKPFTDADLDGIVFPAPRVITAPTTVEFSWENQVSEGLSSPSFKFVELIYSFADVNGRIVSGKLSDKDARTAPSFNIRNLKFADSTVVTINYKIIPVVESGLILDTLSIIKEIATITTTKAEYLAARTLRPIASALINPVNESEATITFAGKTDHLMWTEIRYRNAGRDDSTTIRIENSETGKLCPNFERRGTIHIRCAYNPPETDLILESEWTEAGAFILKHDPRAEGWVVLQRTGNHGWGGDGSGAQTLWEGGNPMLILDDDHNSGWHSQLYTSLPQVLIVDMKETRTLSRVYMEGDYWVDVELYLTDNLSIGEYHSYTIDWEASNRQSAYTAWETPYRDMIPVEVPASWGDPVAEVKEDDAHSHNFSFNPEVDGRFLIIRFPTSTTPTDQNYIDVKHLEVYSN
jgi:hypothetical protein